MDGAKPHDANPFASPEAPRLASQPLGSGPLVPAFPYESAVPRDTERAKCLCSLICKNC